MDPEQRSAARLIHPGEIPRQKQWILRYQPLLDGGQIEKLVLFFRDLDTTTPAIAETIRVEAACFERNAERMRYPEFRRHRSRLQGR